MSLFNSPVVRASDANNNSLSGAKWCFYVTGTLTPASVYSNAALTTSLGTEVTADAGGLFVPIFLDTSITYRAILKTAGGTTIQDIDPIPSSDAGLRAALFATTGAALVKLASGRTVEAFSQALPSLYQRAAFPVSNLKVFGDSFCEQPNTHTSGNSMAKKYGDLLGVTTTTSAVSGNTSADRQTAIFGTTVAATDHIVHAFGQNDAQFVGAGDQRTKLGDIQRIVLANLIWLGVAAGSNKVTVPSMTTAGTWSADADLAGAFKSTTAASAKQATFTNCRYGVLLYKAKISSTGRVTIKIEGADETTATFNTAPESAWVPTNTGQTWAIMARVFDFGAIVPSATMQAVTVGTGEVSLIAMVGFSGDPLAGPLLGVADVSRRGAAGYATATASQSNVPVVNRIIAQALAQAQALGVHAIDLPVASVLDPATDLDTDEFHPSEAGADKVAAAWLDRVESSQGLPGSRPDLLIQGMIQNSGGDFAAGLLFGLDEQARLRFRRAGGSSIDLTGDTIVRHTSGMRLAPIDTNGNVQSSLALFLTGDGNHNYAQSLVGDFVLGNNAGNKLRVTNTSFDPETDNAYSLGSSSKAYSAVWGLSIVTTALTFATLPGSAAEGTRAYITDCSTSTFGATAAGGGANRVPVYRTNSAWLVG